MDAFPWAGFPTNATISGTSELFSTSVAMLGDTYQPYQEPWPEHKPSLPLNFNFFDQPSEVLPIIPDSAMNYGSVNPGIYSNGYENNPSFPVYHAEAIAQAQLRHQVAQHAAVTAAVAAEEARQKEHYFAQKIVDSGINNMKMSPGPLSNMAVQNPHHTPGGDSGVGMVTSSRRPSSVCGSDVPGRSPITSSESGIENDGSPGGSEVNPSDMEEGEGRVMCHACKGLYPSRRSLTGHIGRNEKCREIIGRTYIDQVAAGMTPISVPDSNLRATAMTNGQDGLSPICPHCDKFISHYKGNIRRHINTCGKNGNCRKTRPEKEKERKRRRRVDDGPPAVLHEGFEPTPPAYNNHMMYNSTQPLSQPILSYSSTPKMEEPRSQMAQLLNITLPTDPSPPNPPKRDDPPDDAYICGLCDFVTIYKGNMKRHLNTCHKSNECKDLKEWDRKLESMRASSLGMSREEMLQRLHLHRMNSTRGRKPGKRHHSQDTNQHLPQQVHNLPLPVQPQQQPQRMQHPQTQQIPQMSQQNMHMPQGMDLHQQQNQMIHSNPGPMTVHPQEADFFSISQMNQMHYGYDMAAHFIQ